MHAAFGPFLIKLVKPFSFAHVCLALTIVHKQKSYFDYLLNWSDMGFRSMLQAQQFRCYSYVPSQAALGSAPPFSCYVPAISWHSTILRARIVMRSTNASYPPASSVRCISTQSPSRVELLALFERRLQKCVGQRKKDCHIRSSKKLGRPIFLNTFHFR